MEQIIHFTVRDPENLSHVQADVIDRARRLHPNWEIKIWRVPICMQGSDFLLARYWPKVNSGAQFSDLFRLEVLYKFGGVYIDSDLKLFKPVDDLAERFSFFIATENGDQLTNALIGACKNSPVLRHLLDELNSAEPDWTLPPNITTGPYFYSRHLKWRNDITVLPRESFYPYAAFSNDQKTIHRHSYGEHLWESSWYSSATAFQSATTKIKNIGKRATRLLAGFIKNCLKAIIRFGFHFWHRLQSIDPMRRLPRSRQRSYECSSEIVVQTIHDYKIVVDGRDLGFTPELVFNGFYNLPVQHFLINVAKGGDWMIDVGAKIGTFSLLAAKWVGPFGRIFAFEPNPRSSELMAKSLIMNWMHERVIHSQVAVGESRGTIRLISASDPKKKETAQSIFAGTLRTLGREDTAAKEVACICLDEEFPVDLPIKLLRIDVGGSEALVLAGADRLLQQRCIDFVLMELAEEVPDSRWRETVRQINKVIGYGYSICTLTQDGGIVHQKDLAAAVKIERGNILLVARDQHRPA